MNKEHLGPPVSIQTTQDIRTNKNQPPRDLRTNQIQLPRDIRTNQILPEFIKLLGIGPFAQIYILLVDSFGILSY